MKIAVLVSGGVDSSVALNLLKQQGHELTAFYLKIWLEDELQYLGDCPWEEDLAFVEQVCKQADIPLQVMPLQREYFDTVVKYTINEVENGRTPNPDIMCNNHIKFGFFWDKVQADFDMVATGHYAQTETLPDGKVVLKQAPDPIKDQTYFLCNLRQEQLQKIMFPIGHLSKTEVRQLAQDFDLPNKDRKDSQGICFLGKFKFSEFLEHYLGKKPGDIIEFETGQKIGEHDGFWYHTVGQRKGLGLSGGPWFVVKKDTAANIIYVSKNYHDEDKARNLVKVKDFNWFQGQAPAETNFKVKLRHGENFHNGKLELTEENSGIIHLAEDDQGIAAGQFAAFYKDDLCLGSAVISNE